MTWRTKSGWMCPNGRIIECELYEHLQTILADTGVRKHLDFDRIEKRLKGVEESCQETTDRDGGSGTHAEWHRYEMAQNDASGDVYKLLIDNGYVRIGFFSDKTLHFEGRPEGLKPLIQKCKDLAEERGCDYKFEPQLPPEEKPKPANSWTLDLPQN